MGHVHINVVEFLITGCYIIVWAFLMRAYAAARHEHADGKALGALI